MQLSAETKNWKTQVFCEQMWVSLSLSPKGAKRKHDASRGTMNYSLDIYGAANARCMFIFVVEMPPPGSSRAPRSPSLSLSLSHSLTHTITQRRERKQQMLDACPRPAQRVSQHKKNPDMLVFRAQF